MSEYEISVIIPVYNAEKYLAECLDSVLAQTFKNIEIVLVDDGCKDGSPQIIDQYAHQHENIVAVHRPNSGVITTRIEGLKHATGKYIGWVDADDFIKPTMYEEMYNAMIENNADYVYCDYEFYPHKVASKEKWFKQYYGKKDWNYIERNNQLWNTLTSHALLDELHIIDLFWKFEEYGWISVLLNSKKTVVLNKPLYYYRVGIDSLSGGSYKGKVPRFRAQVEMTENLSEIIAGTEYEDSLKDYFSYRKIYTLLQLAIVAAINSDKENYRFARLELKKKHYKKNPLVKEILDHNHGKKKSFVLRNIIPMNYCFAKLITGLVYGK